MPQKRVRENEGREKRERERKRGKREREPKKEREERGGRKSGEERAVPGVVGGGGTVTAVPVPRF